MKVDVFSIGFGREIVGFYDRKGTRWKISWLPMGGYVKFAGDADPSSRSDPEALKKMDPAERAGSLHFKPLYQRALVAAAGPLANFILAIAIFTVAFMISPTAPVEPPVIAEITPGSAAEAAGVQVGDVIESRGRCCRRSLPRAAAHRDRQRGAAASPGNRAQRAGDGNPRCAPRDRISPMQRAKPRVAFRLGIVPRYEPLPFPQAFVRAVGQTWSIIQRTTGYLGELVVGRASTNELSGPLGNRQGRGRLGGRGLHRAAQSDGVHLSGHWIC